MKTGRLVVSILGLSCGGGGALEVERALLRLTGVVRVYVNPLTEMAYVEYDPATFEPEAIERAVESEGLRAGIPVPR